MCIRKNCKIISFIKNEAVLCISALLAGLSMLFVPPDITYAGYVNYRVLGLLFALMAVVAGLRGIKVLDIIAVRLAAECKSMRTLVLVLTSLCFFSSMLITNDVSLLTFVPLAISVLTIAGGKRYIIYTVILQTVAANMGSMLTPMGNPQNLYLADFYKMSMAEFFGTTAPICAVSGIMIFVMVMLVKSDKIRVAVDENCDSVNKRLLCLYIALGIMSVSSVFNIVDYRVLVIVSLILVLIFDRALLKRIDWLLLLTFVMFFVFVGNAARLDTVREFAGSLTQGREIIAGVVLSQFISNVPAAAMLSSFTDNGTALMAGVDIGGLGTPVASLASLISYRLYSAYEGCDKVRFMRCFLGINFAMLVLLLVIFYIL